MQKVNIYMISAIHGPRIQVGKAGYLLEMERDNRDPVTLSKIQMMTGTENEVNVKILLEVLKRLNKECELCIFTESNYLATALTTWLAKWQAADWKTAKNDEVSHKDEWQEILKILNRCPYSVKLKEQHSYKNWLIGEINRN